MNNLELNLIRAFNCYHEVLNTFRMLNPKVAQADEQPIMLQDDDWREAILACFDGIATEDVPTDIKLLRIQEAASANASLARGIANELRTAP